MLPRKPPPAPRRPPPQRWATAPPSPASTRLRRPQAPQARTKLFGHVLRVLSAADDARADEDDQLGAAIELALAAEEVADDRQPVQARNAGPILVGLLADQATEQDRLPVIHRHRAFDGAVRDRRGERCRSGGDGRNFLPDIEVDDAVIGDARLDIEDDAGVAVLDLVAGGE